MNSARFCFNLNESIGVGRLIGPAAVAAVSTAGFYVWVLLSLGEMVEVGLIAVAARRHGEGRPDLAARAAGAAVLYALGAGTVASLLGFALTGDLFRLMTVPHEVAALGSHYIDTWLLGGRSEEHTSELQSPMYLVCSLLLEKKKTDKRDMS